MKLKLFCGLLAATTFLPIVRAAESVSSLAIGLAGDSTVCDYPGSSKTRGWGQLLPEFLAPEVIVRNEARGGLSTKTFPRERWQSLLAERPGYVLIQFGHNDSHAKDRPESTDAATEYAENLRRFVREARDAGVVPILVTPVRRRMFRDGRPTEELAPYADSMRAVAAELSVPLVDLFRLSGELYTKLGEQGSTAFTLNQMDHADRPGMGDRTHFTEYGARQMAALVAGDMVRQEPGLKTWVKPQAQAAE